MNLERSTKVSKVLQSTALLPGSVLQRKCAYGSHSTASVKGDMCTKNKRNLQRKLAIGASNDPLEREADRVADQVLAAPVNSKVGGVYPRIHRFTEKSVGQMKVAPASVDRALATSGRPLDPALGQDMERRFGSDFSQVRVHSDGSAALATSMVNARAFTIGQDIFFGRGQYSPGTDAGKRLLAHELSHTIQQQTGLAGSLVQRTVIDDVREKLSYGVFDWAITDADAMEALALLGTIPAANLAAQLQLLGDRFVTRLLENLPDAAKTGEVYRRVVEAAGAGRTVEHATEQLSYGLFDWAITDTEVTRVYNILVNLPAAQQEELLGQLNDRGRLSRLISNSNSGHHALYIRPWISSLGVAAVPTQRLRGILRIIVTESPDSELETLRLATEKRFRVAVGRTAIPSVSASAADWNPSTLRETYLVLDRLPEAHVAANSELLRLGQFSQAAAAGGGLTAGIYSPGRRELGINVRARDIRGTAHHEVAHAVDEAIGWSTGPEPARPQRGGWHVYGANYNTCATAMVADSNGAIQTTLNVAQRNDVVSEMATAMGNRSVAGMDGRIRNLPWFAGLAEPVRTSVPNDRALAALGIGLNQPWFNAAGGGEHLGPHVYQESYANSWVRYRHAARARKVSLYQFRDPRDWFAEAYRFYYMPDSRGRGMKLADHDPDTKTYFDTNVHTAAGTR